MTIITDPVALRSSIIEALSSDGRSVLGAVLAVSPPAALYVAGGAVRDAMRGSPGRDMDLVVEGDAIAVAQRAAGGRRVTVHRRFGTATIAAEGARIDIAMARSETYARPGALPKVAPADIETDLRRRDFTVNAMALRLDGDPALIDLTGGIEDLRARSIRVPHDASFRDDATRIFRAFRYASRLDFQVDPHTKALIGEGVRYVEAIGGERLRSELELLFAERSGIGLEGLDSVGVLRTIHSTLHWSATASGWLGDDHYMNVSDRVAFGFGLMASQASSEDARAITARLKLKRNEAAAVAGVAALNEAAALLSRSNVKPSGAVQIFERYTDAAIGAFGCMNSESVAGKVAQRYLMEWQSVKPLLTGRNLIALGVPEGPRISQALQLLRAARLDGTARDRDDERMLVARFTKSIRDSSAMTGTIELSTNGH